MRALHTTKQFRKDLKRLKHSKKKADKLWGAVEILMEGKDLPQHNKPHMLSGEWKGYCECHIEPDLLLIYAHREKSALTLVRIGSHAELFDQ